MLASPSVLMHGEKYQSFLESTIPSIPFFIICLILSDSQFPSSASMRTSVLLRSIKYQFIYEYSIFSIFFLLFDTADLNKKSKIWTWLNKNLKEKFFFLEADLSNLAIIWLKWQAKWQTLLKSFWRTWFQNAINTIRKNKCVL